MVLVGSLALSVYNARRSVDNRIASNEPVELAAEVISVEAGDESCGVLTSYSPQITFYSACAAEVFRPTQGAEETVGNLPGEATFMVLIEDGKRQPTGEDLEGLLALTESSPVLVDGAGRDGLVYRFTG